MIFPRRNPQPSSTNNNICNLPPLLSRKVTLSLSKRRRKKIEEKPSKALCCTLQYRAFFNALKRVPSLLLPYSPLSSLRERALLCPGKKGKNRRTGMLAAFLQFPIVLTGTEPGERKRRKTSSPLFFLYFPFNRLERKDRKEKRKRGKEEEKDRRKRGKRVE